MAENVTRGFLAQALDHGLFHADLHEGNLFVAAPNAITAVDYGIIGRLGPGERRYLAEILYGFLNRDYARVAKVHFDADFAALDRADLPSFRLDPEVNQLLGRSQTPLVVLAESDAQADAAAASLRKRMASLGSKATIGQVATLSELVPNDQLEKQNILEQIDRLLEEAGTDKTRLLIANIWLSDIRYFDDMNKVWEAWVSKGNTPVRATVEAKLAGPQYLVEIMVQAAIER